MIAAALPEMVLALDESGASWQRTGMIFHPEAEQRELITDAFSRPLDALLPLERLHQANPAEPWRALAELGIFGVAIDPDQGGVGLSAAEEALLAIELGQRLAGAQVIVTLMAAHCTSGDALSALAAGETRVAPAVLTGDHVCAIDADGADRLLLRRDGEAALIDADMLGTVTTLADRHWSAPLGAATMVALPDGWADAAAVRRIRLIEAAALAGMAKRASMMAVDYAGFRQQFGHAIGGFQAVKHHCANMAMAALAAADLVTFAAVAVDQGREDATFLVEAALLQAMDAALANSRLNIQVHGGIGFSEEADPHLVLKRAHLLIEAAGGAEAAAERVAQADAPIRRVPHN